MQCTIYNWICLLARILILVKNFMLVHSDDTQWMRQKIRCNNSLRKWIFRRFSERDCHYSRQMSTRFAMISRTMKTNIKWQTFFDQIPWKRVYSLRTHIWLALFSCALEGVVRFLVVPFAFDFIVNCLSCNHSSVSNTMEPATSMLDAHYVFRWGAKTKQRAERRTRSNMPQCQF